MKKFISNLLSSVIILKIGSTRLVLILFRSIVLKFALPYDFRQQSSFRKKISLERFIRGVHANVSEWCVYHYALSGVFERLGLPNFCTPVYSLVVVNIQRYEGDVVPSIKELDSYIEELSGKTMWEAIHGTDTHTWVPDNFRIVRKDDVKRIVMVDYADSPLHTHFYKLITSLSMKLRNRERPCLKDK